MGYINLMAYYSAQGRFVIRIFSCSRDGFGADRIKVCDSPHRFQAQIMWAELSRMCKRVNGKEVSFEVEAELPAEVSQFAEVRELAEWDIRSWGGIS